MEWLVNVQTFIRGFITGDLSRFAATHDWVALVAVLPLGIAFGAVHALTPGHGKSVLASYVVGSRLAAFRAAGVAGVLALTHVGMGVLLALLAAPLIKHTIAGAGRAPLLELTSAALLVGVGVWLLVNTLRSERVHRHEGPLLGVFAGLVPCPLTLFTMMYALARGVPEAGITFAVAMTIGITTTLSLVAVLAVLARDQLLRFMTRHGAAVRQVSTALNCLSGVLLVVFGISQLMR